MNLFSSRHAGNILIVVCAILLFIVIWLFTHGQKEIIETTFIPVNEAVEKQIAGYMTPVPVASSQQDLPKTAVPRSTSEDLSVAQNKSNAGTRLNLNLVTIEQLEALPGIGKSKAEAILQYRQEIGSFTHINQLLDVKGIGEKLLAKISPYVMVSEN